METQNLKALSKGIRWLGAGSYLIQVARGGRRATCRFKGTLHEAERKREELLANLWPAKQFPHPSTTGRRESSGLPRCPTLREWLRGRYARRSEVVQSEATRVVFESYVRCLIFYLGDKHLDEIDGAVINEFVERRRRDGAASFTLTKAGAPKRGRTMELKNSALNKPLSVLRAALNLAVKEGVLPVVPRVELLPENDCEALTPPSAAVLAEILAEAENHRAVAPWLPEAIELSVETGLRKGELFNLTWGNVDWDAGPNREGAIIVAEQTRGRLVGGKLWKPKNRRTRMVPLSPRARELLEKIRGDSIPRADALVIPNINASPYERVQSAKKGTGANTWRVMKEAMGHNVRWHDLRHLFAVRCLQANIPISTVSAWLGHSDINLTVKRYGRFAAETHEQWRMMARTGSSAASNARGRG